MQNVLLTREPLDEGALSGRLRRSDAGAIVRFAGTVRAESQATRQLTALDYEAYESMALEQMESIRNQAIASKGVLDAVIAHRLGRLRLGETSIVVIVLSPHRAEAFEACRWMVDQVKTDVPIWKKDIWSDGTEQWVDPQQ